MVAAAAVEATGSAESAETAEAGQATLITLIATTIVYRLIKIFIVLSSNRIKNLFAIV